MAGFIPEITTRITVNIKTEGLDEAIIRLNSDSVLSNVTSIADELNTKKSEIKQLQEPLGESVAELLQSNQSMIISSRHYITGMFANSVDIIRDGSDYLVGNTAMSVDGFPYPLAIEKGRRAVYPINRHYLRWFDGGDFSSPVFAKYSRSVDADPFVQPSIDDTLYGIDKVVDEILDGL